MWICVLFCGEVIIVRNKCTFWWSDSMFFCISLRNFTPRDEANMDKQAILLESQVTPKEPQIYREGPADYKM